MNKNIATTNQNSKLALAKAKDKLNMITRLLSKEQDEEWIEKLWRWADKSKIKDCWFMRDIPEDYEVHCGIMESISSNTDCLSFLDKRYLDKYDKSYEQGDYLFYTGVHGLSRKYKQLQETNILHLRDYGLQEITEELYELKNLKELDLGENKIKKLPKGLSKLQNLEKLILRNCGLEEIPEELCELKNLKELDLGENKIKKLPKGLSKLQNLEEIVLRYNYLEEIPEELCELKNLKELDLGNNKIKKIPKGLSTLENLTHLILRHNYLEEFPSEIEKLKNLEALFLRHNKFEQLTKSQFSFYGSIETHYGIDIIPIDSDFRDDEYIEAAKPFTIANEKVWTDPDTSFMWQVDIDDKRYTWKEAFEYANRLNSENYGGYSDWRVPTIDELSTIFTKEAYEHSKSYSGKTYIKKPLSDSMNMEHQYFWSSSTDDRCTKSAYFVLFEYYDSYFILKTDRHYVRCVREESIPTIDIDNDEIPF